MSQMLDEARTVIGVMRDWLGEGGTPIDWRIAEHRASVCVECTQNVHPKWWEQAKEVAADYIRERLSLKHRMKIGTSRDEQLHMCRACGCCLPLKVHVPIEHIIRNTSAEVLARFPKNCWIPKEKPTDGHQSE